jgi:hypothetical protein
MPKPDLKKQLELAEQALRMALDVYINVRAGDDKTVRVSTLIGELDGIITHSVNVRSKLE